jgi:xanthine dehydrogenase accessory factor
MAKKNLGTKITDAPVVIGVGPGFCAGLDCHAVIETQRGHTLGRVITEGSALPNTGIPGSIGGYTLERLLRSPADGVFEARACIGGRVAKGDTVAMIGDAPLLAGIDGILRGLLPSGITVTKGMKAGDIDPRCEVSHCFTVSDKALAVAGGVLEAILRNQPTL